MADYETREKLARRREELAEEAKDNNIVFDYYSSLIQDGMRKQFIWHKFESGRETKENITTPYNES